MKTILKPLLISLIAGLGTLLGSFIVFIPKINKIKYITLFMAFSATIMLYISIFDLLPESVFTILENFNLLKGLLIIILSFLLGIIIINILDKKIEEESNLKKIGVLSMIALMIHNFPEGIATFMTYLLNKKSGIILASSIMMHNIPEGITIAVPISNSTHSPLKGVGACLLASLAEPLGAIITYIILKNYINNIFISIILIFVSGIMINLSINNIYKFSYNLNNKKYFIYGILIALIYIIISIFI